MTYKYFNKNTDKSIKDQYRAVCMVLHPDRGGSNEAFKEMKNEYEHLSNPEKPQPKSQTTNPAQRNTTFYKITPDDVGVTFKHRIVGVNGYWDILVENPKNSLRTVNLTDGGEVVGQVIFNQNNAELYGEIDLEYGWERKPIQTVVLKTRKGKYFGRVCVPTDSIKKDRVSFELSDIEDSEFDTQYWKVSLLAVYKTMPKEPSGLKKLLKKVVDFIVDIFKGIHC